MGKQVVNATLDHFLGLIGLAVNFVFRNVLRTNVDTVLAVLLRQKRGIKTPKRSDGRSDRPDSSAHRKRRVARTAGSPTPVEKFSEAVY